MSTNSITFGTLTAKSAAGSQFGNFDFNKDGFIDLDEFLVAIENWQYDSLEISQADKNKDQTVTQEEFDLWAQEEEINKLCEEAKTRAAKDLVGEDNADIVKFLGALDEFKQQFLASHKEENSDVVALSEEFANQLLLKYDEIKDEIMQNTRSAIKTRVIENIADKVKENKFNILGISDKAFSDNIIRLLGNMLQKEADKFTKKYNGDDFESDLTAYLEKLLNQSDREKLAGAINMWEKDLESISEQSPEFALKNMKDKARHFLTSVLDEGISVTMGSVTIRTAVGITPALAQYKNIDTLLYAIKDVIKNLSRKSKLEQMILDADEGSDTESMNISYDLWDEPNLTQNIFEKNRAA